MAKKYPTCSRYTMQALALLGERTKLARKRRRWSQRELADRLGVSRDTVRNVEAGDPRVAVGTSLEMASLVGIPLFSEEEQALSRELAGTRELLALLPRKIQPARNPDDDF